MKKLHLSLAVLAIVGLVGCGDSDSVEIEEIDSITTDISTTITGQLVDNYVENVSYKCGDDSTGTTGSNGEFSCTTLPVEFSVGGLRLGSITTLNSDRQVFPQDLIGVDRADTNNGDVLAMAQFLQSCDNDNDLSNGIEIDEQVISGLESLDEEFDAINIEAYMAELNLPLVTTEDALEHLESTTDFTTLVNNSSIPATLKESYLSVNSTLDDHTIEHLTFMGNEERLAFDIYNELYKIYPTINQLTNIATNGEYPHIEAMQLLIKKYDIKDTELSYIVNPLSYEDTPIEEMEVGVYDIPAIQNLYNILYAKGSQSAQDALEVGCMVEVTDINDLDLALDDVREIDAPDVEAGFEFLIQGSYNHYWAFDSGLKNLGIVDGCCSLGVIDGVDYCKNSDEYPQAERGGDGDNGDGEPHGENGGEGHQHGRQ
ncbi:MAG: DUF2202 domain-containing protein [Campylobacterota bacterium]|nr:DUF2202 domain-containing protein [Campylobacterota bacterium]